MRDGCCPHVGCGESKNGSISFHATFTFTLHHPAKCRQVGQVPTSGEIFRGLIEIARGEGAKSGGGGKVFGLPPAVKPITR